MGRHLVAAAVLLALTGCGSAPAGSAPAGSAPLATPSPAAGSPAPAAAPLTNADSGRTVSAAPGATIEVALRQEPGHTPWGHPLSSDPGVLQPTVDVGATSVVGVTLARFRAVGAGRADLSAAAGVACSQGAACPDLARAWRVTVVVA
jgi:hypothetical protein